MQIVPPVLHIYSSVHSALCYLNFKKLPVCPQSVFMYSM
jgi:hypothetical protein